MNKIKIIDLLNMISKGEEVPKKIKFDNQIWNINYGEKNIYYTNYCNDDLFIVIFKKNLNFTLNDKVEILEEEPRDIEVCGSLFTKSEYDKLAHSEDEKKIPEKMPYKCSMGDVNPREQYFVDNINTLRDKINEILDYLESKGE